MRCIFCVAPLRLPVYVKKSSAQPQLVLQIFALFGFHQLKFSCPPAVELRRLCSCLNLRSSFTVALTPHGQTATQTPTHMLRLISPVVASPALLEGCSSARILAQAQQ